MNDLILQKLSLSNEYDVFYMSDITEGIELGYEKFRLQNHISSNESFILRNHLDFNSNGYQIQSHIIINTEGVGILNIHGGMIEGNIIINQVDSVIIDACVDGNITTNII